MVVRWNDDNVWFVLTRIAVYGDLGGFTGVMEVVASRVVPYITYCITESRAVFSDLSPSGVSLVTTRSELAKENKIGIEETIQSDKHLGGILSKLAAAALASQMVIAGENADVDVVRSVELRSVESLLSP
nr:hypothetical protein Iba_chr04eCG16570 [Ipomoea batatas]